MVVYVDDMCGDEALQEEANWYHQIAERKYRDVENCEDDLARRFAFFKSESSPLKREQELLGAKAKIETKESELIQKILAKREDLVGEKEEDLQDAERKILSEKKKLNHAKKGLDETRAKQKAKHRLHRKELKSSKDGFGNIAANRVASNDTEKADIVTTPTSQILGIPSQKERWPSCSWICRWDYKDTGTEKKIYKTTLGGVDTNGDHVFLHCEIQRQTKDRVAGVRYTNSGSLLACQQAGKTNGFFRVLSGYDPCSDDRDRAGRTTKTAAVELMMIEPEQGISGLRYFAIGNCSGNGYVIGNLRLDARSHCRILELLGRVTVLSDHE
ncbi:hypothetical protein F2Q70_00000873 [Brassica cretica]|uniref:Uncharacterized protein n=1 Tax=Brassica cretica TaxID=69181 RepID=A0A8S9IVW5_BRACR|nr:hypothetical protein F2Q70_00000873 [Brassica cretica]